MSGTDISRKGFKDLPTEELCEEARKRNPDFVCIESCGHLSDSAVGHCAPS